MILKQIHCKFRLSPWVKSLTSGEAVNIFSEVLYPSKTDASFSCMMSVFNCVNVIDVALSMTFEIMLFL